MFKHAYLIIAHESTYNLKILLKLIDDPRNDIFIHMDKKKSNFIESDYRNLIKHSNIYFVERTSISWGSYSLLNAELLLLKIATDTDRYLYYHLLSGNDLLLKNQDYIHTFFWNNRGYEFVNFESITFEYIDRIKYYYPFREKVGNNNNFYRLLEVAFLHIQKKLNISKRNICNIKFQKGSNWFSITDSLARFVILNESWIKKIFKMSFCCDEIFLQTLILNSNFINRLYYSNFDDNMISNMRYIDWNRGRPYVFRESDYYDLINNSYIFARKFDSNTDKFIIDKLYYYLTGKNQI